MSDTNYPLDHLGMLVIVLESLSAGRGIIMLFVILSIRLYRQTLIETITFKKVSQQPYKTYAIENFLCSKKNMELVSSIL